MKGVNFVPVQLRLLKGRSSQMSLYYLIVYDCGQELSIENRAFNKREATYTHFHILGRP
jgi:hypothetical protein